MKQLLLQDDLSAKDYLTTLLDAYPYTIDHDIVYTLLHKTTYPHPSLIMFLQYFAKLPKYHLCFSDKDNLPLTNLAKRMSDLYQLHETILPVHLFLFDATIYYKKYNFHNPYAHLPLTKIVFLDKVLLHKPHIFQTPVPTSTSIQAKDTFLYKNVSLHAQQFIALSIQIVDKTGIIFMPRSQLGSLIALSQLFQSDKPSTHQDFFILCGISAQNNDASYYYDATNELYIGYLGGDETMSAFPLVTKMIQSIYQAICIKKHDLTVNGFMINLQVNHQSFGIVFCGNDHDGIHELAYTLSKYQSCYQDYHITTAFKQSGTLHFLDNDLFATGIQVGDLVPVKLLDHAYLLSHLHQGMWLNPEGEAMLLHHQLPFEVTKTFHRVTHFLCVNIHEKTTGIHLFKDIKEAKLGSEVIFKKAGYTTYETEIKPLLNQFIDIMYLHNIIHGELFINGQDIDAHLQSCKQVLETLFNMLKQGDD